MAFVTFKIEISLQAGDKAASDIADQQAIFHQGFM